MKSTHQTIPVAFAIMVLTLLNGLTCPAATLLVWQGSPGPTPPYATWETAATNIQAAIDAAQAGDTVLVTNGVYATGGRIAPLLGSTITNRLVVAKPLTVRSVNGPQFTLIQGYQVPVAIQGDRAIRCVYLTNGAFLAGFTLTNGATHFNGGDARDANGGGVWCESTNVIVSNCVVVGNSASIRGGGVNGGTLINCTLSNNYVFGSGGGAYGGSLMHCTINSNTASSGDDGGGGGVAHCDLTDCTLTGNRAGSGGGALVCNLSFCTLTGNRADHGDREGGGAAHCTLNNCLLTRNSAFAGGGADGCDLNNCTLIDNLAFIDGVGVAEGGGASYSRLKNCTVVENRAGSGGGVFASTAENCIIYSNHATNEANYAAFIFFPILFPTTLNHCCTTPLPTNGVGNFTNAPLFDLNGEDLEDGIPRLQTNSPCINSGRNASAPSGSDLDGLPRIAGGTVDIGAYEFQTPASTLSYAWLLQHGLALDGSADTADPDGDLFNNDNEWHAGTDPTNAFSLLRLLVPVQLGTNLSATWLSVAGHRYAVEGATDFGASPRFTVLATNLPAASDTNTTTFIHTNAASAGPWFYRVRVED